jgi:hypothetical protein
MICVWRLIAKAEAYMIYFGHFSFVTASTGAHEQEEVWHGYFTCVAQAESVELALAKFEALLRRLRRSHQIFTGVDRVHLDSCIEIKSIPVRGFLAYYCEEKGQRQPAITTSLLGVSAKHAAGYQWMAEDTREGDDSRSEPFLVFEGE